MSLFLSLYLGHVLGDFAFQPGRLVVAKRRGVSGVVLHTAIVMVATAVVAAANIGVVWPAVLLAGLAHFGVEHLTIGARRESASSGLTIFLLDQGAHIVSLVLLALVFTEQLPPVLFVFPVDIHRLAVAAGLATVALAGSILVFEVEIARRPTTDGTDAILALDRDRLYGMAERAGALAFALALPVPALGAIAFAPRAAYALALPTERRAHHLTAAAVGLGLCTAAWVLIEAAVRIA
jgi:hypothetical protein